MMARDSPFYRLRMAGEQIWRVFRWNQWWSCELRDCPKYGIEAGILRNDVLVVSRLFPTRKLAVEWADDQLARF